MGRLLAQEHAAQALLLRCAEALDYDIVDMSPARASMRQDRAARPNYRTATLPTRRAEATGSELLDPNLALD